MRAGIFFDRDGTINEEAHYLSSPEQLLLIPSSTEAIREAKALGYCVFIISNQSGIARGYLTEEQVRVVNESLLRMLQEEGADIDGIFYCPHHSTKGEAPYNIECDCRKPRIGMLLQAAKQIEIDFTRSFVIGDKISDVQTGFNAGGKGILVKTGYGLQEMNLLQSNNVTPTYIAENAYDAIQFIKQHYPQPGI